MGATSATTGSSPVVALGAAIGIIAAIAAIIVVLLVIQRNRRQYQAEPTPPLTWSERVIARLAPVKKPRDEEKGIELQSIARPISTLPPLPAPGPYRKTRLSSIPENPFVVGDKHDDFETLSKAPPQKALPDLRVRISRPGSPYSNEYKISSPKIPAQWGRALPRRSSDESRSSTSGNHS